MTFVQWIETELKKRNWNRAELARKSGLSTAALSHIYAGTRNPGSTLCKAIARAFNLPESVVFLAAGVMEPTNDIDPAYEELKYWFSLMTGDEQEEFLASGRWRVERRQSRGKGTLSGEPRGADN